MADEDSDQLEGTWTFVEDGQRMALPIDENGVVENFLVRLRLLNYVYDLPSQLFQFTSETRDVIRLSVPEVPLPPRIHMLDEQAEGAIGDDEAMASASAGGAHAASSSGGGRGKGGGYKEIMMDDVEEKNTHHSGRRSTRRTTGGASISGTHAGGGAPSSGVFGSIGGNTSGGTGLQRRTFSRRTAGASHALFATGPFLHERGWWDPDDLPHPRNFVYVMWRSAAHLASGGNARYDLYLSSCVVIRNTTKFNLSIFPSVPGPTNVKKSVFAAYHKKFMACPSRPPTHSMPPFVTAVRRFQQMAGGGGGGGGRRGDSGGRRHLNRQMTLGGGGGGGRGGGGDGGGGGGNKAMMTASGTPIKAPRLTVRTIPPTLKLPAMEHYIIEDPSAGDIGRKFSMVAGNPSEDEENNEAGPGGGTGGGSGGGEELSLEKLVRALKDEEQIDTSRRQGSDSLFRPGGGGGVLTTATTMMLADQGRGGGGGDEASALSSPSNRGNPAGGFRRRSFRSRYSGSAADLDSNKDRDIKGKRSLLSSSANSPATVSSAARYGEAMFAGGRKLTNQFRRRRRRGTKSGPGKHSAYGGEYIPLVEDIDYIDFQPFDSMVKAIPLYWTLADNAPLWVCLNKHTPKSKGEIRRAVRYPTRCDFLTEVCAAVIADISQPEARARTRQRSTGRIRHLGRNRAVPDRTRSG